MKRKIILLVILPIIISFTGCMRSVNLNDRAIVQAMGIDYKDEVYKLTVQIFSAEGGGSKTAVDPSKQNAKIIKTEGTSIVDAISKASLKQGKEMFYGHNKLIVIGEELAKFGLSDVVSFLSTDSSSRLTVNMLVSKGEASKIMTADVNQGIMPAESIDKMISNSQDSGRSTSVRFFDMAKDYDDPLSDFVIPVIELKEESKGGESGSGGGGESKPEGESGSGGGGESKPGGESGSGGGGESKPEGESGSGGGGESKPEGESGSGGGGESDSAKKKNVQDIALSGLSVFCENNFVGYLDDEETRGLSFITDKLKSSDVTVRSRSKDLTSVDIFSSNSKITPRLVDDSLEIDIKINAKSGIKELVMQAQPNITVDEYEEIGNSISQEVARMCLKVLEKTFKEYKVDVFNINNRVAQKYPKYMAQNKDNWQKILPEIKFNLKVDVIVDRFGLDIKND